MTWLQGQLCALIITVAVRGISAERCTPGVEADGYSREFKVCSKNANGELTLKTLSCGENSYYSKSQKKCVTQEYLGTNHREGYQPMAGYQPMEGYQPKIQFMQPPNYCTSTSCGMPSSPPSWDATVPPYVGPSHTNSLSKYTKFGKCPIAKGQFCENCKIQIACVNYIVVDIKRCSSCNGFKNKCFNSGVHECVKPQLECSSIGLFPDPYFCHMYHLCTRISEISLPFSCGFDFTFDSKKESCNPGGCCFNVRALCPTMPECKGEYEVGAMESDPRYYYFCSTYDDGMLKKLVLKCDRNQYFDGIRCVN